MNKFTNGFWKYTTILLIVGAILVLVGGLSIGRSTINKTRELGYDMSAKARAEVISNENRELKEKNTQLEKDKEIAIAEKLDATKQTETLVAYIELSEIMNTKKYDVELAKEKLSAIDETLLPDSAKENFRKIREKLEKE